MKYLTDIKDLNGKKFLFRTDFDIPVSAEGQIQERFRIEKQKEAIDLILSKGGRIVLVAHISAIESFGPIVNELGNILGHDINLVKEIEGLSGHEHNLVLLDNIRRWPEEMNNDETFARKVSSGFDLYVNNCFSTSHRKHAMFSAVTLFLPSYAGPIIESEVSNLNKSIESPPSGKVVIIGGAKGQTKLPVVKNFLDKADKVLVGGIVANDIILAKGLNLEVTNVDEDFKVLLKGLDINHPALVLPEDYIFSGNKILDIGPKSIDNFVSIIKKAKMIIWNGPVGLFEKQDFSSGTFTITKAVAESSAFKIVGGGDTIIAIDQLGVRDKFDFISTGGGAMLYFLSGEKLPGLEALGYYN